MATLGTRDDEHRRFWDVAEPFLATGTLVEGSMMGHQCLRASASNGFVATVERVGGNLVVKLPRNRVSELIETGEGLPFAPARKVFREWVALPVYDEARWTELIEESIGFVDG
ncbi:hypothetical protein [Ilumatobacter sp.]|uniref:hypothetical protein n=1 Tax=Ilumatobacter sp. TaxID=1967498 RepID=UPI003C35FE47